MSVQRRVLLYLLLTAIASCLMTMGVGILLVKRNVAAQRIASLERQAEVLSEASGALGAPAGGDRVYRVGAGRVRALGRRRAVAVLASIPPVDRAQGSITVAGSDLLYAARATAGGRVVLVRSAGLSFAEWRPFLPSLLLAGLGGSLLALALSYLLARRLTRPIKNLSTATKRVAAGEAGVEVPAEGDEELAQLGGAFNEMTAELSRARDSQRRFLESVSHELKTPLTSIRGYAEAIDEGAVSSSQGARVIATEADRLKRLVQDLLDLARLGRTGFSIAHEAVDLATVASRAVDRHLPQAREMSVELSLTQQDGALAVGDADRLLQAISNLIENALRLTPAGGRVVVEVAPGLISVRDSGPGLADEDIPRAFDRFYLHDRYASERPVGTGLGLAIVKEMIVAMGGQAQAARTSDGGAKFVLKLPQDGAPAATQAHPAPRGAAPPSA